MQRNTINSYFLQKIKSLGCFGKTLLFYMLHWQLKMCDINRIDEVKSRDLASSTWVPVFKCVTCVKFNIVQSCPVHSKIKLRKAQSGPGIGQVCLNSSPLTQFVRPWLTYVSWQCQWLTLHLSGLQWVNPRFLGSSASFLWARDSPSLSWKQFTYPS